MVHNGIEYADMQLIAEAYDVLKRIGGVMPDGLAKVFADWNKGPLESFLIEITAQVFRVRDPKGGFLVDHVLDKAGQKGTGKWTAQVALDLAVPIPGIAAAIDARVLSSMKADRERASKILRGPKGAEATVDRTALVNQVHDALYAAKIVSYAQGLELIDAASREFTWGIDLGAMARIWKGGCIIRARFLDDIRTAYDRDPALPHLLLDEAFRDLVHARQQTWRDVVCLAQQHGIPVPGMSSSLAYFDSYRSENLPQNLTQAQRDAFGSHTYQRRDDPDGPFVHTDWLT
jgi:6-phosphogluconate dehydrogenase